jgi:hypothetical protein
MSRAKPTVAVHIRVDVDTHQRGLRLQEALQCQMPELVRRALMELESSLKKRPARTAETAARG